MVEHVTGVAAPLPMPNVDTDVIMPNGSGFDLATQAQEDFPTLPVLYMTGYTENAIVHRGELDPGVILLAKPFSTGELLHVLRLTLDDSV